MKFPHSFQTVNANINVVVLQAFKVIDYMIEPLSELAVYLAVSILAIEVNSL